MKDDVDEMTEEQLAEAERDSERMATEERERAAALRTRLREVIERRDVQGARGQPLRGPMGLRVALLLESDPPRALGAALTAIAKGGAPDPADEREALAFLGGEAPAQTAPATPPDAAAAAAAPPAGVFTSNPDADELAMILAALEENPDSLLSEALMRRVVALPRDSQSKVRKAAQRAHVAVRLFDEALRAARAAAQRSAKDHADAAKAEALDQQRAADEASAAAQVSALEAEREADPERRHHYAEIARGAHVYVMRPGRTELIEKRNRERVRTNLAEISAVVVEETFTYPSPDAPPDIELRLEACLGSTGALREISLPAAALEKPAWTVAKLGKDGGDTGGRAAYDHFRRAIFAASQGVTKTHRRHGYLGWVPRDGGQAYVHGGGAIGVDGAAPDLVAVLPRALRHFELPAPPEGVVAERAVKALLRLLAMDPPTVTYPMAALTFHAPLGGNRLAFHGSGITDVGKSVRASLFQRFYGRGMHHKAPPASWEGTPSGTYPLLAAVEGVLWIDDLRASVPVQRRDQILRAHFNESGAARGTQSGGLRELPMSRCDLLSVGEIDPRGETASTLNRILTVDIGVALPPETSSLYDLAAAGAFDSTMALYLRWLAPRIRDVRAAARAEERAAAVRWGFDVRDRTAELMGGYALGMESCLAFLDAHGVPAREVERHRQGAAWAFSEAAGTHRARVDDDDVARRMLDLVMNAIAAGRAHTPSVVLGGAHNARRFAPPDEDAHVWGYRREGEVLRACGDCVGYHLHNERDMIHLNPGAAVAVALREAKLLGRELGGDVTSLGRALLARGHIAKHAPGKATIQTRLADGSAPSLWAVHRRSMVGDPGPDPTDPSAVPTEDPAEVRVAENITHDQGEFPDDINPFATEGWGTAPS